MKKLLLGLFLLPIFVFGQSCHLRDSVYIKTSIFEAVYSEVLQQPKFVSYTVQCPDGSASRKGMDFYSVNGVVTSDNLDYVGNVWDKGHMAPAADFNCTTETLFQTFSYVNCALQHERLNRCVWRILEKHERELASQYLVIVQIRIVYGPNAEVLSTGATVPTGFYKTITYNNKIEKYYFPNVSPTKSSYTDYLIQ